MTFCRTQRLLAECNITCLKRFKRYGLYTGALEDVIITTRATSKKLEHSAALITWGFSPKLGVYDCTL